MAWETSLRLIRVGVRNVILLCFLEFACYSVGGSADSFDCPKPIPNQIIATQDPAVATDEGRGSGGARDNARWAVFVVRAVTSLVSVPIEYLAKLRGQSGSREWLLNEMCFARFNTLAQHSIGCVTTHEHHGDGGVIPTHTIS